MLLLPLALDFLSALAAVFLFLEAFSPEAFFLLARFLLGEGVAALMHKMSKQKTLVDSQYVMAKYRGQVSLLWIKLTSAKGSGSVASARVAPATSCWIGRLEPECIGQVINRWCSQQRQTVW